VITHRTTRVGSAIVAITALTLAGCTSNQSTAASTSTSTSPTPQSQAPSQSQSESESMSTAVPETPSRSADLDLALAELVAMPGGPPGVIAVVQIDDERTVHTAGVGDLSTGAAPTIDDHMRIASTAKAFSGATALSLVDKGQLSLDDTIGQRLPDLPAAWSEVTLRQLLSHTSGLPDFTKNPAFGAAVGASLETPLPPSELLKFVADQPLDFPAGSQYAYDNSDNIAVGLMIEAATAGAAAAGPG
jgi:D-alanyl-D-alanine carboxypeptidase